MKLVDSVEKAVVQYRIRRDDGICLCRNLKFLPGDEKHILAALRDETDEVMEQIRDANILALKNSCINFIVSNLCENFMTVDVRTGMSTTVIGAGNGEMLPQQTFNEQILWFAENVVVPEERENYIQYFALDNLVARIRENGGGTVSMFCNVIYEDGRHELLIRSTLVKDTLDLRGEYVLLFAQDMTSIRKIEEANRQLMLTSRHDKLTGLLNRAAAEKLISEHLDLVGASSSYCFLLLDIDYFKSVNDRFGHLAGDSVLQYMGSSMRKSFRSGDVLCRWGGDEFVIFLRGVRSREIVRERLDALRARLLDCRAGEEPLALPSNWLQGAVTIVAESFFSFSSCTQAANFSSEIPSVCERIIQPAFSTWSLKNSPKFFIYILHFPASTTVQKAFNEASSKLALATALITSLSLPTPEGSMTIRSG